MNIFGVNWLPIFALLLSLFSFCDRASSYRSSLHERRLKPAHLNFNKNEFCLDSLPVPDNLQPDTTFTTDEEAIVLQDIYRSTGGPYWTHQRGWNDPDHIHHCSWYGVKCDNRTHYVISLDFSENNLTNTLPSSLWKLRNLLALCAPSNTRLGGELRSFLFPNMSRLIRIDLAYCSLTGHIPQNIANLLSLVKIQLCCQQGLGLSGPIPYWIGNLTDLQVLSIGENDVSGDIPESIGKLYKLRFLDLEILSGLRGNIELFYNLSSMVFLHVSNCGIHGNISDDFGTFYPEMNQCLLPQNNLQGMIPSSIKAMKNLTQLVLSQNKLTGVIPRAIGDLPSLRIVDLSGNDLLGFQNGTMLHSSKIEVLILSNNRRFSSEFNNLIISLMPLNQSIRILNVSTCHLTGYIPVQLWSFPNLISIDIRDNEIRGAIPDVPFDLLFLLKIDFSINQLSGPVPASFSQLHVLQDLDISGNPSMSSPLDDKRMLQNFFEPDLNVLVKKDPSDKFSCPYVRFSFNNGLVILDPSYYAYSYCVCDIGYYGYGNICRECMEGGKCMDRQDGSTYPSVMTISTGYWPSPSPKNTSHLVSCDPKGLSITQLSSCNPNGSCTCNFVKNGNSYYTHCEPSGICSEGSYDRFCTRCMTSYYRSGNICSKCPDYSNSVNMITLFVVMLVLSLVVLWWAFIYVRKRTRYLALVVAIGQVLLLGILWCFQLIPGWLFEINVLFLLFYVAGSGKRTRGLVKISIFYIQIVDAMISAHSSTWPPEILQAHHYISSVVNFHFLGMACEFPSLFTPIGKITSVLLVPLVGLTLVWMYYVIVYLRYRKSSHETHRRRVQRRQWECRQASIVILNIIYFPVVKQTITMIAPCDHDGYVSYMHTAPWVECTSRNHTYVALRVIAWGAFVFYVLGIPLCVFLPLLRKYLTLRKAQENDEENLELKEKQAMMDLWLGSIYLPYKESVRAGFETVALLRKFLIAFVIAFLQSTSIYQTLFLLLILSISLIVQLSLTPYIDSFKTFPLENACETIVLLVLLHSFVAIQLAELTRDTVLLWVVIGTNMAVVVLLVASVIIVFLRNWLIKRIHPEMEGERISQTSQTTVTQQGIS
ncbi:putative leucine-rich repeat-containing protein DDB_G0281931 [Actinia tenebrosa]|uniref:Leucine-rich repeat-containing protein DDB_G0281931 n=1 Tax=Actinia tenebrosa TaxID=6105 RepID=A0A6P8HMY3_ACTTE|nr:putative leucine-rich repeat-containing protein DDB_G0281931 [Actinia tenebrosa]